MEVKLKHTMFEVKNLPQLIFPNKKLPFTITNRLLSAISYGVPQSHTEANMATWLNGISNKLAEYTKVPAHRKWDPCMKNTTVLGSSIQCKPNLVVVPKDYTADLCDKDNKPNWKDCHTYTEITSQSVQCGLNETTWQKSFVMFKTQPTRCFILNLTFNDHTAFFFVCDLASVVHCKPLPLDNRKRVLVWLIAGFAFGQEYLLKPKYYSCRPEVKDTLICWSISE